MPNFKRKGPKTSKGGPKLPTSLLDSMVGYWDLDETTGDRLDSHNFNDLERATDFPTVMIYPSGDISFSTNGIRRGALEISGRVGLATNDSSDLSMGNFDFAIACWVKILNTVPNASFLIYSKNNTTPNNIEYQLFHDKGINFSRFRCRIGSGSSSTLGASLFETVLNQWYFVVLQHDATNNLIILNINNGSSIETFSHTTGSHNSSGKFYIGANVSSLGLNANYLVDEVAIWKRLLTASEINALHNNGKGRTY